jgi:hypothetical protein
MGALLGDCVKAIETRIRRRKTALAWLETTEAAETKFAGLLRRKLKSLAGTCKAAGRGGEQTCSYKHILGTRGEHGLVCRWSGFEFDREIYSSACDTDGHGW